MWHVRQKTPMALARIVASAGVLRSLVVLPGNGVNSADLARAG